MRLRLHLINGQVDEALHLLKALTADVPYSNKKLASMDMEERYRLLLSTIFHAIGLRTEVEHMTSKGRIDILVYTERYVYVIELKLSKNGGIDAAEQQIKEKVYAEPFMAGGRQVIPVAIEVHNEGKGITAWKQINL